MMAMMMMFAGSGRGGSADDDDGGDDHHQERQLGRLPPPQSSAREVEMSPMNVAAGSTTAGARIDVGVSVSARSPGPSSGSGSGSMSVGGIGRGLRRLGGRLAGGGAAAGFVYPLEMSYGGRGSGGGGGRIGPENDDDDEEGALAELSGPLLSPSSSPYSPPYSFLQDDPELAPRTVPHRWIQLGYLSALALLSDLICFSTASNPEAFERAFGHSSAGLIDLFLFTNVASCFLVTDVVAAHGLQRCVRFSAVLMAAGCWLRSGLGIVPALAELLGTNAKAFSDAPALGLVPYPMFVAGTVLVGAAQPFFQCTPPLLSAQWFASDERATSTAIALNFNQIGIATAFLVGGEMAVDSDGLRRYFALIAVLCTVVAAGTFVHFQSLPPVPPSASELEKRVKDEREPPFHRSVRSFFSTPRHGFARPLAAFVCSISITNVVGAFIDEIMERGGVTDRRAVAWAGVGFELAIVLGGIVLGRYVDRTKAYKSTTSCCVALSLLLVIPLGLTEHRFGKEPALVVTSLLLLGFVVGPVQPINAELAVDVTYPGDETAVESVQQIGGNLVSALLVPIAERAARDDYQLLPNVPALASDIRGDVVLLMFVSAATYVFFSGFSAPLKRSIADGSAHHGSAGGHHLISSVAD